MKIKGVYTDKKRKGDPIEFTPEEKVPLAVMDAIVQKGDDSTLYYVEGQDKGVTVEKLHHTPIGEPNRTWESKMYSAQGRVSYRKVDPKKDKLYRPQEAKFQIKFKDCCDEMGMPDLEVESFNLS